MHVEKKLLLAVALLLSLLGVFFIFDVSTNGHPYADAGKQFLALLVGSGTLLIGNFLSSKKFFLYAKIPYLFYLVALILLGSCLFLPVVVGSAPRPPLCALKIGGATRWLSIFGVSFQASELAKFCLIVFFAYLLPKTTDWRVFLGYFAIPAILIALEPDFGSLAIISASLVGMYFLAGSPLTSLLKIAFTGLLAAGLALMMFGYARERIATFLHPETASDTAEAYQVRQMEKAIRRGGVFGQGLGQSMQKFGNVPVVNSDSIISIIAEEVGFVGITLILFLYLFFCYLIWRIVTASNLSPAEKLLGQGIFIAFVAQIFINIAAISHLIPLSGLTLPFMSNGGTSLVISLFFVGVVAGLANVSPVTEFTITRKKYV